MKHPKFLDFVLKPVSLGLVVFCFLLLLTQYLSYERYLLLRETETRELTNEAYAAKGRLQTILSYNLSTAQTLAFIVQKYGVPRDFDNVGASLLRSNEFVDAVQLVQGGIITHVFPREGNEGVIGYNILKDSLRNSGAFTAIKTKQFFWAGPIDLKQGGVGIIGRQPLFRDNKFKGFSAVIIRLPTFLKAVGIDSNTTNGFYYQLSKINPDGSEVFFLPNHQSYKNALIVPIKIPNGEWKLYVGKRNIATLFFVVTFSVFGLILSILGGLFVWYFVRQPEKLNKLVEEKTRLLSKANEEKGTVLNRITDAMISLDNESRITFINQRAQYRLFKTGKRDVSEQEIIGKKIWEVYEGVKQTVFWEKYLLAIQTQKEVETQGYFKPTDRWLLMKIYPSLDGVTIYSTDMSDSKKAQQEILLEKNFSDSIINSLPGVFYLYDQAGKFIRWNKNFETVSGYSAGEIGSENPPDFFDAEEKKRVLLKIKEALKTGEADEEVLFYTKDKKKIPYYFNGRVINLNGKKYLMGMGIDITERIKAERQILLEKNLSESVINSLPGVFYMADVNGRPLRWNRNFEMVTGYTGEEIGKMRIADFVAANDKLRLLERKEVAIQQGSSDVEAEFVTKQNEKIPYYFTSIFIRYNEQPSLLGIGIDITERKKAEWAVLESEEKYRSVIQSSPDIIMRLDLNEKVQFINYTEGGFTQEQIIGASAYDFVLPEYHDLVRETHHRAITTKKPQTYETVSLGQDGIKRWFFTSVGPIILQGKVTGITLITRDITERKTTEEEIKRSQLELRQLSSHLQTVREEERTGIAREIHDELGQQLTALKMDTSWLTKKIAPEDKALHEKLSSMIELIDDTVKTIRRISSGLRPGILDDLGLIAALEWQGSEFEKRTGINCLIATELQEMPIEKNISTGIFRVYQEALTNIMRHAQATLVETSILKTNGLLVVTIKDNGKGFDMNDVKSKNTLGIVGMKERALMFGGELDIESKKGTGTEIILKVPLHSHLNPQT